MSWIVRVGETERGGFKYHLLPLSFIFTQVQPTGMWYGEIRPNGFDHKVQGFRACFKSFRANCWDSFDMSVVRLRRHHISNHKVSSNPRNGLWQSFLSYHFIVVLYSNWASWNAIWHLIFESLQFQRRWDKHFWTNISSDFNHEEFSTEGSCQMTRSTPTTTKFDLSWFRKLETTIFASVLSIC